MQHNHALPMHSILLCTRNITIHLPCIIHALCIHALSMRCHPCITNAFIFMHSYLCIHIHALSFILLFTRSQAYHNICLAMHKITYIGAISFSVLYGDQRTPNFMLITSYPCNSLHQKHACQPHSCLPNNAMLACHIFCEFNSSMISNKHTPHVGYHNQPIKYNFGYSLPCITFSFHL